jgi:murein DD-endopeptidase MepM/ murein hydrolase activator NlpD
MPRRTSHPGTIAIGIVLLLFLALIVGSHSSEVTAAAGISLRPPFDGTYRLTSFFDHYYPNYAADPDGRITIYTGENVANCSPHCYRGHSGYDWAMPTGTQVLASADGTVESRVESNAGYGNRIVIRHDNGHRTLYAHFREHLPGQGSPAFNVVVGQRVRAGDVIGWSGSTGESTGPHLHFGVYRGPCVLPDNRIYESNATDPFGWRGIQSDPLSNFPNVGQGHTASCLWRSRDQDSISCADTIVEDAGQGSTITGAWNVSTMGNGYHMYYRYTTTDNNIYATWTSNLP